MNILELWSEVNIEVAPRTPKRPGDRLPWWCKTRTARFGNLVDGDEAVPLAFPAGSSTLKKGCALFYAGSGVVVVDDGESNVAHHTILFSTSLTALCRRRWVTLPFFKFVLVFRREAKKSTGI